MKKTRKHPIPARTAFIFDMDGTLVDNMAWHTRAWVELLADHGRSLDVAEFSARSGGRKSAEVVRELFGEQLSASEVTDLVNQKELLYRSLYRRHLKLLPGLRRFLTRAVKLGIPMAVATAAPPRNISFLLDGLNLRPFF
ncbi:MAG TPA: HAD hydrolase-like protein, partial [Candidatus Ozemobacteraceae bacterium]|nr:HAD hydrolase-like protein [Candidatus Ozemobacteraceae bacterium]